MATTKTQTERNRASMQKLGKKLKAFALDAHTLALFDTLAAQTGQSHVQLLRQAMQELAQRQGISVEP